MSPNSTISSAAHVFRASALAFASATLLAFAGCGGGLVQVPGEVKLAGSGAPVPNANVQFHPVDADGKLDRKRNGAVGQTDAAGKFTLATPNQDGSGAFPGTYKVTVEAHEQRNFTDAQKAFPGASIKVPIKSLVAPEYTEISKTPLQVTIPSSSPLVLEVKGSAK